MVSLAGTPAGRLLDPFCGTGTILAEAAAVGWTVEGGDIDADAVVSNLPFGRQYEMDAGALAAALREMDRVTAPTGAIVVLYPSQPLGAGRAHGPRAARAAAAWCGDLDLGARTTAGRHRVRGDSVDGTWYLTWTWRPRGSGVPWVRQTGHQHRTPIRKCWKSVGGPTGTVFKLDRTTRTPYAGGGGHVSTGDR